MRKALINLLLRRDECIASEFDIYSQKMQLSVFKECYGYLVNWRKYASIHGLDAYKIEANEMHWQNRLSAEQKNSTNA